MDTLEIKLLVEENVPPNSRTTNDYHTIQQNATKLGYNTDIDIVDAASVGGAQSRSRGFLRTTKNTILPPPWDLVHLSGMSSTPRPLRDHLLPASTLSKSLIVGRKGLEVLIDGQTLIRPWISDRPHSHESPSYSKCHYSYEKSSPRLSPAFAPHQHHLLGAIISRYRNPTTTLGLQPHETDLSSPLRRPNGFYPWISLRNRFAAADIPCSTLTVYQASAPDFMTFPIDVNQGRRNTTGFLVIG